MFFSGLGLQAYATKYGLFLLINCNFPYASNEIQAWISFISFWGLEEQNVFSKFFTMVPDTGALYNTIKATDQTGEEI